MSKKTKKNHGMPPVKLRPGINICLTITDLCLPIIAWQCNDAFVSWRSQLVPSNLTRQSFLFICISLPMWICLKKCSENRVLVVLLQIGTTDLTVYCIKLSSPEKGENFTDSVSSTHEFTFEYTDQILQREAY